MENTFFNKTNFILVLVGTGLLVAGFFMLAQPPVNGFLTMNAAPVILSIAYCIIFPLAIIYSGKKGKMDKMGKMENKDKGKE